MTAIIGGEGMNNRPAASLLARTTREQAPTLTPALSLAEGEGAVSIPSPPEGERVRVRGSAGRGNGLHE